MAKSCPTCAREMGFEPETLERGEICEGCGATGPIRNHQWTPSQIAVLVIILLSTVIAASSCDTEKQLDIRSQKWMLASKIIHNPVAKTEYFKEDDVTMKLSDSSNVSLKDNTLSIGLRSYQFLRSGNDSILILSNSDTSYTYFLAGTDHWKNNSPDTNSLTAEKPGQ